MLTLLLELSAQFCLNVNVLQTAVTWVTAVSTFVRQSQASHISAHGTVSAVTLSTEFGMLPAPSDVIFRLIDSFLL